MRDPIPSFDVAPIIYEAAHKVILNEALSELGLQQNIKIVEIKGIRWSLDFDQDPTKPDVVTNLLKLEKLLKQKTRKTVDIRLPEKKDKNNRQERNLLWKEKINE